MNEKLQKIIARVNQLRAISKSTHSRHEAETTAALAAKLIAEYQVSEAQIETELGKSDDPLDLENEHIVYETGRTTPWKARLVWGLADLNGVYAYVSHIRHATTHKQGARYRIIGRVSDIEITKYMFEYLVSTISELVNDYVPSGNKRGVNPERESWCLGAVDGFISKMKSERDAVMRQATSQAMVLVSQKREEAKTKFLAKSKLKMRNVAASKAQVNADTYGSGYRKGQTLSVNKGIGGSDTKATPKLGS